MEGGRERLVDIDPGFGTRILMTEGDGGLPLLF